MGLRVQQPHRRDVCQRRWRGAWEAWASGAGRGDDSSSSSPGPGGGRRRGQGGSGGRRVPMPKEREGVSPGRTLKRLLAVYR